MVDKTGKRTLSRPSPSAALPGASEPKDGLGGANAAYDRGDFATARRDFQHLIAIGDHADWAHFQLGRIALREGDAGDGLHHFESARRLGDLHPWLAYEELCALLALGRHVDIPATFARFMATAPADLTFHHAAQVMPAAHIAFEHDRAAVVDFYRRAIALGSDDYLAMLRDAEALEGEGAIEAARLRIEHLRPRLDHWGRAAEARILARAGRIAEASRIYEDICRDPGLPHFFEQYFDFVLAKHGSPEQFERFFTLARSADLPPPLLLRLRLRQAIAMQDAAGAMSLLRELSAAGEVPSKWLLIDLIYLALARRNEPAHGDIAALLANQLPDDPDALEALINRAMGLRRWDEAEALLDRLERHLGPERPGLTALKRFELACFRGDLASAAALRHRLGPLAGLDREALPSIYRYLAEVGEWQTVADDAFRRLPDGEAPPELIELIVRAVRRTGRRDEMLRRIREIPDWRERADLRRLYAVVGFDSLLIGDAQGAAPSLVEDLRGIAEPDDRARLRGFDASLRRPAPTDRPERVAVFLCTNRSYLIGTAVTLWTLLANNPAAGEVLDIFVCAAGPCLARARRVLGPIARRYRTTLQFLDADEVCSGAELKSTYGLFTGGHVLATEAYWRLYVGRHLAREGHHTRAIYLDSDIAVGPHFLELLDRPLPRGACVLARPEVDREEVRIATERHRLLPGTYFNSGVLVFDLANPQTENRLQAAIAIAETEADRLLFQDQCALNIAFAGATRALDEMFNRFAGSAADEARLRMDYAGCGVLHFLDRPKPWDPLARGAPARLWLELWRLTASFVPVAQQKRMLVEAFA